MPGDSPLRQLEQILCRLVRDNVRLCLDVPTVKARFDRLPTELRKYVESQDKPGEQDQRLLTDVELEQLEDAADRVPLPGVRLWQHWDATEKLATSCTGEIKHELAAAEARRWSESSEAHLEELTRSGIDVREGITEAHRWLWEIRRYLSAIETDAAADSSSVTDYGPESEAYLEDKRKALRQAMKERGENVKAKALFRAAGVRYTVGYKLLKEIKSETQAESKDYGSEIQNE